MNGNVLLELLFGSWKHGMNPALEYMILSAPVRQIDETKDFGDRSRMSSLWEETAKAS